MKLRVGHSRHAQSLASSRAELRQLLPSLDAVFGAAIGGHGGRAANLVATSANREGWLSRRAAPETVAIG